MTYRHDVQRPTKQMNTAELRAWLLGLALLALLCLGVSAYIISNLPPAHHRIQQLSGSHWQAPPRHTVYTQK